MSERSEWIWGADRPGVAQWLPDAVAIAAAGACVEKCAHAMGPPPMLVSAARITSSHFE